MRRAGDGLADAHCSTTWRFHDEKSNCAHPWYPALLLGLLLSLVVQARPWPGNIDPVNKWVWGTNAGWINFAPEYDGVTVVPDHLEGYAWGENIGWIRLGTYIGGGSHTYGNDAAGTYGVNQDGAGHLSGYAWGTNVGWINFAPANGGVTIDPPPANFRATPGAKTSAGSSSRAPVWSSTASSC